MRLRNLPVIFGMMIIASPLFAQSAIVFDEAVSGELSGSGLTPTPLTLGLGLNTIQGTLGENGNLGATNGTSDADFFTFNLAPGQVVTAISTTRPAGLGFFGQANGSTISATTVGGLDSGVLFSNSPISASQPQANANLPTLFSALPLTGTQSFVIQETGAGVIDYSVTFTVANAVPEPSSAVLLGGLSLCGFLRRRRS